MNSANGWRTGGEQGPAIAPGQPEISLLLRVLNQAGTAQPAAHHRLPDEELAQLEVVILDVIQVRIPGPRAGFAPGLLETEPVDFENGLAVSRRVASECKRRRFRHAGDCTGLRVDSCAYSWGAQCITWSCAWYVFASF